MTEATPRPAWTLGLFGLGVCCLLTTGTPALAGSRFAFEPAMPELKRAVQYAAMSSELCLAELDDRGIPYERAEAKRGVETPIRITGVLHGVQFVPTQRTDPNPPGPWTILDCRLALAIDDLAEVLARQGVVRAEYMSLYRPGFTKPGVRHPSGRAIDLDSVALADGRVFSVKRDFHGRIGAQTCGEGAEAPRIDTDGARFWRSVMCAIEADGSFNLALSPNHDYGHRDHLHLEVRSGIHWFLVQ